MSRNTIAGVVAIALALVSGSTGCVAGEHAHAQGGGSNEPPTPITGVSCFANAERRSNLTYLQQRALCLSAPNPQGPVDCYVEATRVLGITDDQAVLLCRCSATTEPVDCWQQARQQRLTDDELAQLCSPTLALGLLANCRTYGN